MKIHILSVRHKLCLFVSKWFQIYFIPLLGVFFTFPSRYLFTIGLLKYLVLELGRPRFPRHFTWIEVLRYSAYFYLKFGYRTFTLFGVPFQKLFLFFQNIMQNPATPTLACRFRLFRFRSPLLTESHTISFLPGTEMFHFPEFPSVPINRDGSSRFR